jgi:ribose transport system substrate-binding protein
MVAAGLYLVACGSASASAATTSASAYQKAVKLVKQYEQRPTTFSVPALPRKPKSGGTLDFMVCGAPACLLMEAYAKSAVLAAGWNFVPIQQGLTPEAEVAAYQQAILNHPNAVIGTGLGNLTPFVHQLQLLKNEGVSIVEVSVTNAPAPGVIGVTNSSPQTEQFGREMADFVLAQSHAKNDHVLYVDIPDATVYAQQDSAFSKALLAGCSSCSVTTLIEPATSLGSTMPTDISSYILSHPNINWVFGSFADALTGLPSALASNGLHNVKLITDDTTATEDGYLTAGQQAATAAVPWGESLWGAFNLILANSEHVSLTPAKAITYPSMIMTGKNLITTSAMPALVSNFPSIFKAAWHEG